MNHPELFLLGGGRNTDKRMESCYKALATICKQRKNNQRQIATVLTYSDDNNPGSTGTKLSTNSFTVRSLHLPKITETTLEQSTKESDVLFIKGGNTIELYQQYARLQCATTFLRSNTIIAGNSAGALVHSIAGISDSVTPDAYSIIECAGTIPCTMDVHHDDNDNKRTHLIKQLLEQYPTTPVIGIQNYAALHIRYGQATVHGDHNSVVHIHSNIRNLTYKHGDTFSLEREF